MAEQALLGTCESMEIRFISTLTSDDEERVAGAFLAALSVLLDGLPITYALRIQTTGDKVFQRTNMPGSEVPAEHSSNTAERAAPPREHIQ